MIDEHLTMYICLTTVLKTPVLLILNTIIFQVYISFHAGQNVIICEIVIERMFKKVLKSFVFILLRAIVTWNNDNDDENIA